MAHVQKPYEFPHALWVRLARMAPESHGIPRNPMETNGNPSRNPMEILSGIATTRCKMKPTSPGTVRLLAAPPAGGTCMYFYKSLTVHRNILVH